MASDRDLKTLPRQRIVCSAGDGAPAQRFSDDERLRAAPLEPREGLSQAKTLLPLGRSVSKKRTMYQSVSECIIIIGANTAVIHVLIHVSSRGCP